MCCRIRARAQWRQRCRSDCGTWSCWPGLARCETPLASLWRRPISTQSGTDQAQECCRRDAWSDKPKAAMAPDQCSGCWLCCHWSWRWLRRGCRSGRQSGVHSKRQTGLDDPPRVERHEAVWACRNRVLRRAAEGPAIGIKDQTCWKLWRHGKASCVATDHICAHGTNAHADGHTQYAMGI